MHGSMNAELEAEGVSQDMGREVQEVSFLTFTATILKGKKKTWIKQQQYDIVVT